MSENKITENRKFVSRLIYRVLAETLCIREAILKFPKEPKDKTINTVYHALVHREADEDLRARDLTYKEEQDDYLEMVAEILQKGENLPDNIIKSYDKYYKDTNITQNENVKGLLKSLCKFLNV